jgi:VWFA-related protein
MSLHDRPVSVALSLLLAAAIGLPVFAQQQLPASGETIDVSLVNVDVFVTDKKGKRVTGLTAADFEIRENGRVQPVTNFAEYRRGAGAGPSATAAPPAKRTILVFVERFTLPNFQTRPLFAAIRKTLRDVVRPGDSAAVVFWDLDSAYTLQDFTDDLPSLQGALVEVERQSTGLRGSIDPERRRALARSYYDTLEPEKAGGQRALDDLSLWDMQSNAQYELFRLERKSEELQSLMRSMSDEDGRKIVIFATNDFGVYPHALTVPFNSAPASVRSSFTTDEYRDAVARTANEHGVTIYPVYPVGLDWTPTASAMESRENIFAIDSQQDLSRAARDYDVLVNQTSALDELARDTGGLMAAGSRDIVKLLPQVEHDLEAYYSLAYRTPATGTTRSRDILVKAKNSAYTVRSRREYVEKTDVTRMQDRVIANLYRPDGRGAIPLEVELGQIDKTSRNRWSVPLKIRIPVEALALGGNDEGAFSVFTATGGVLGLMSDVEQRAQHFAYSDIESGQTHFTYEMTLTFNGATSVVSIGVLDERSKDFGLQTVDLPAFRMEERAGGE